MYDSILNRKNILITGGTGSFGYQILKELSNYKPKSIVIFSRDEDKQNTMKQELREQKISKITKFVIGDVRDYDSLYTVCKNIDIVFHAAALKQVPTVELYPFEAVKTNILGSHNVVKASIARGVKHVVAVSTDKAVKPVNAMGMTKALQEKIFRSDQYEKNNTIFCSVRYGNVLGSRGSVIPLWDKKIENGQPLPVTHSEMTRFLLTLHDAIQLVFYAVKNAKGGEIFVKKAPSAKIVDLAKAYAELVTKKKNYPIEYVGIRPGEKIHELLISEEEMRFAIEKKDHYIIKKEEYEFDKNSAKKKIRFNEYSSGAVKFMSIEELKDIMKHLSWVV
ncbi:SDR family NAD(P)-dependent oxidoreductase [Nitrosopumilus sp. b2]|uniref:SDR family NAD(P)-dependent oxidoreductase n=1 Tax=Nitrosopumilus sp. b2 TaxID=2109908 RepID=UPI002104FF85|nr:SDR family NAD(P)-dependent oxidoreductase [Nitrosopumilus sp. b2]